MWFSSVDRQTLRAVALVGTQRAVVLAAHAVDEGQGVAARRQETQILEPDAEVVVTDSGIGIAIDEQSRIFERFYRVDPSRSRETGGTGLGLAIVKHIALNHGGEINVFSKPGLGSTFTLTIPLEDTK